MTNKWLSYVNKLKKKYPKLSYKQLLKKASGSYQRGGVLEESNKQIIGELIRQIIDQKDGGWIFGNLYTNGSNLLNHTVHQRGGAISFFDDITGKRNDNNGFKFRFTFNYQQTVNALPIILEELLELCKSDQDIVVAYKIYCNYEREEQCGKIFDFILNDRSYITNMLPHGKNILLKFSQRDIRPENCFMPFITNIRYLIEDLPHGIEDKDLKKNLLTGKLEFKLLECNGIFLSFRNENIANGYSFYLTSLAKVDEDFKGNHVITIGEGYMEQNYNPIPFINKIEEILRMSRNNPLIFQGKLIKIGYDWAKRYGESENMDAQLAWATYGVRIGQRENNRLFNFYTFNKIGNMLGLLGRLQAEINGSANQRRNASAAGTTSVSNLRESLLTTKSTINQLIIKLKEKGKIGTGNSWFKSKGYKYYANRLEGKNYTNLNQLLGEIKTRAQNPKHSKKLFKDTDHKKLRTNIIGLVDNIQRGSSKFIHIPNIGKRKVRYYKNGKQYVIIKGKKVKLSNFS